MRSDQGVGTVTTALSRAERRNARSAEPLEVDFWTNYGWLITTSLAMIGCYLLNIPNAGAFLLLAVIHSTFVGGWKTGLASAGLATVFSSIFLSVPDQLFHYSSQDARSLFGIATACFGAVWLIVVLRKRDAAAIHQAVEELRSKDISQESRHLFERMADCAPVLMWLSDVSGSRNFFNRAWLQLIGQTQEAQQGEQWLSAVHPEDVAGVQSRYTHAVNSGERFAMEYRVKNAAGQYVWLQDIGAPRFGPSGEYLGYVGCCIDRTERKRVETALHQLSGRLLELQDDERRRISRELHDTTAQNLAALSMNLFGLKESSKVLSQKAQQILQESLLLAERCSQEIRTLSYLLHPPLLDELGLVSALRSYTAGFTRRTNINVELKMDEIGRLPLDIETTLFRIVQEALTNVHRHSGSQRAEVRVVRDPNEARLQVNDEGTGMPPEALELISEGANLGVGIAGMRERARQLGGQVKIASSDRGTTITAILPLKRRT